MRYTKLSLDNIRALREEFWTDLKVTGSDKSLNQTLEQAGRVADFLELSELMCTDALDRTESCGAHFRLESQNEGEALRDDENWTFCSAWESEMAGAPAAANTDLGDPGSLSGPGAMRFTRHTEPLAFAAVPLATRSYA